MLEMHDARQVPRGPWGPPRIQGGPPGAVSQNLSDSRTGSFCPDETAAPRRRPPSLSGGRAASRCPVGATCPHHGLPRPVRQSDRFRRLGWTGGPSWHGLPRPVGQSDRFGRTGGPPGHGLPRPVGQSDGFWRPAAAGASRRSSHLLTQRAAFVSAGLVLGEESRPCVTVVLPASGGTASGNDMRPSLAETCQTRAPWIPRCALTSDPRDAYQV